MTKIIEFNESFQKIKDLLGTDDTFSMTITGQSTNADTVLPFKVRGLVQTNALEGFEDENSEESDAPWFLFILTTGDSPTVIIIGVDFENKTAKVEEEDFSL